jgi:hypothetical protein
MYAIIIEGRVAVLTEDMPPAGSMYMEYGPGAQVGWVLSGGVLVAPPAPDPNAAVDVRIAELEARVTQRRLRDAALTDAGKEWLADVDAHISELRAQRV